MQFRPGTERRTPEDQSSPMFSTHHVGENTERRVGTKSSGREGGLLDIVVGERDAVEVSGEEGKS